MGYYSIQDYIVYIAILGVVLWLLYRYFFTRVRLDRDFVVASAPYMLIGILVRVLADVGFFPRSQWWSITPGIYILAIGTALVSVLIGLLLEKRFGFGYWRFPLITGSAVVGALIYYLVPYVRDPVVILYPIALAVFLTAVVRIVSSLPGLEIFRGRENTAIVFAHLLDGCSSFYGIQYHGFIEEHLLPRFLIDLAGNAIIMIPLKLSMILIVIYLLEKWYREEEKKDESIYRLLRFVVFILGIGPGLRNSILPLFQ